MTYNLMTVVFVLIVASSMLFGAIRGFGQEIRLVISQVISIGIGLLSIWIAWLVSHRLSAYALHEKTTTMPHWLASVVLAWQQSPRIGNWVALLVVYIILSSFLHRITQFIAQNVPVWMPVWLRRNKWLGAIIGVAMGIIRSAIIGALVFLVLQYVALPGLSKMANASKPYKWLSSRIYTPWLKPIATKELPVFADGALHPIAQNISLFAVPSEPTGSETGVLIVPKQITSLSQRLTKNSTTPQSKAKILYEWEIHHIKYDWKKYDDYVYHGKWDAQSPLQTLQTGKGVCADYALLYADLAHAAGLTVQIDEGMGGTAGQFGSHAWNQVYIPTSKQWITVDTTWGASQDAWFDVPQAQFDKTHIQQTAITVRASGQ